MLVTTITKTDLSILTLPEKVNGRFWIKDSSDVSANNVVSVEAINEEWIIKSNKHYSIVSSKNRKQKSTKLKPLCVYILKNIETDEDIIIFTEPVTKDRQIFNKYIFEGNIQLTIGRTNDNDIQFKNNVVSSHHAYLTYKNGHWSVTDNKSTNGTFVNNKRVSKFKLTFGDCINIMGLKIILGRNFLAINNPDGYVNNCNKLSDYISQDILPPENDDNYELDYDFFYRSPRFKRDIEIQRIVIDSPPASPVSDEMPTLLVLGTSLTMGMMSFVTLSNAIVNGNVMSIAMGGSMLLGTVLFPVITKTYEKNKKFKKEKLRQKKYNEYLDQILVKIDEIKSIQEEILRENIISISECEKRIIDRKRNLWDRSYGQDDFLHVRVGSGTRNMALDLSFSEKKFSLDEDSLKEELYMLGNYPKKLDNVPIVYSLFDDYISGIIGKHDEVVEFTKGLIIQLASMYSYDEVKLVFIYNNKDSAEYEFTRWLPHVWSDDNNFRFIATNNSECKELSVYLEKILENRSKSIKDKNVHLPYYVIFSLDNSLGLRTDVLKSIFSKKENSNFSVVTCYDELKNLPQECTTVVEINEKKGRLFNKNEISSKVKDFEPDIQLSRNSLLLGKELSNIYLDNRNSDFNLPNILTFMNLFGVGKIEHINALSKWNENDPTKSLAAAVGVNTLGDDFILDIHEKYHGPHGLVAGMTGSGKSEFIITYILSLAVNYHPNEVAFVLIDYKGGGMAKSFENLPHTVGIITNLDGASIKRSLVSIESELKRRQAIFSEASKKINISNIDIYKYQKLYRDGQVNEPLPHLLIISDEFAELKTQQPEFMTQLVSAARIGRSLGVHLILATQKPSGVVDDQIWSNSRFRVCLKVQERADSMDMLKREDAAELTDTGRFYLQVGYNELFEMGQSAWSGAPYYPSDSVLCDEDNEISIIDNNAHILCSAIQSNKPNLPGKANKQVDEITDYLSTLAKKEGIVNKKLWLEPIAPIVLLDSIRKKYKAKANKWELNPLIGEYDDPSHQRQNALFMPITKNGNSIIYGSAGSGKTTFLNAMLYSLITEHSDSEVNIYILDFASESLRAFQNAPHVGDVVFSHDEEKITNLFKYIHSECKKRKKLFADFGGDYKSYIEESGCELPYILIVINNFAAFTEIYNDREEDVSLLSRDGLRYGIYFVLTATAVNGVRFRLAQNFNLHYVLQMNDQSDYSTIVGRTEGLFPSKYKGRGLVKLDSLFEFQTGSLVEEGSSFSFIKRFCNSLSSKGNKDISIPVLPKKVDKEFILKNSKNITLENFPIGVSTNTMKIYCYNFKWNYINMILGGGNSYDNFYKELLDLFGFAIESKCYILGTNDNIQVDSKSFLYATNIPDCESVIHDLYETTLFRNNEYKANKTNIQTTDYEQLIIIINDYQSLYASLSEECKQMLKLILEKGYTDLSINILFFASAESMSSFAYESWFMKNVSPNTCIWVGDGIAEQYNIKLNSTSREMREKIGANFGYVIDKGSPNKIKIIYK